MLPIAIGLGVDPSFRSPMAVAVIGGLVTSTFLSLLIIPVVFTFVDDVISLLKRLFHRRTRTGNEQQVLPGQAGLETRQP
jgi:hypothetical protein